MATEVTPKVWGSTECLISTPTVQLHRIKFLHGGVCSEHYHRARYNAFYVLSGQLRVTAICQAPRRTTLLTPGCPLLVVPPGIVHWFEGMSDGIALELYYPSEVQSEDIVRLTQGFMR